MSDIRHALIMAAGRGTRMGPLTLLVPKPMAPLGNSTLILHGIRRVRQSIPNLHVTVGYKAKMLAEHVIEEGVSTVINTEGKGNAWWVFNTLLRNLDEPLLVLTCDNLLVLDHAQLAADYHDLGCPACMVVPVEPVQGLEGDYIFHQAQQVTALSRVQAAPTYCSGIQLLNPAKINKLLDPVDDFNELWSGLIRQKELFCSRVQPEKWFTIDTIHSLAQAEQFAEDFKLSVSQPGGTVTPGT